MATATHPRLLARGTAPHADPSAGRVLAFSRDPDLLAAIEADVVRKGMTVQLARSVSDLVAALVEDPPPRPQILIADFESLSPGELLHLHVIREHGWFGSVIALGRVPLSLRSSLGIDHVLAGAARERLRAILTLAASPTVLTLKIPKLVG